MSVVDDHQMVESDSAADPLTKGANPAGFKEEELTCEYCVHSLQKMYARQSAFGLPGTDGSLISNIIAHTLNEHIILGIFKTNSISKFTKKNRLAQLFSCATFTFYWTTFFAYRCPSYCNNAMVQNLQHGTYVSTGMYFYKIIFRYLLECPCHFQKSYIPTNKEDGDLKISKSAKKEGKDDVSWLNWILGHGITLIMLFVSIGWLAPAIQKMDEMSGKVKYYWLSFLFSLALSFVLFQASGEAFTILCKYKFTDEIKNMREHFGIYLPKNEEFNSITQLGLIAKANFIKRHGVEKYRKYHPNFDHYFHITDDDDSKI
jgi:hypothetical protein